MVTSLPRPIAVGIALALTSSIASAETVTWDLALFGSPAFRVAGEALADYVNENGDGDFTITVHNGTLSPAQEIIDNLSFGAFQLGYVVSSYHPGKNPLMSVLDLPFLPIETMEERAAIADALFENQHLRKEFGKWSAVPIMAVVQPNYEVMGKGEPPTSLARFDGMRIKATGGIGDALAHFGARNVPLTGAEQYNALQTGVIDAVAATPSAHGGWKLYELSDWYTRGLDAGTAHVSLVANRDAYEALTDSQKALLDEAVTHAYAETIEAQSAAASRYAPVFAEHELEEVSVPPEMVEQLRAEAARPVWEAYVADLEARGLPGREILDFVLEEASRQ